MPTWTNQSALQLRAVLDAIPVPVFVVDEDVRVLDMNEAARPLAGDVNPAEVLYRRGGHVLHCIHAHDVPEGCGRGPSCKDCAIRNSVTAAFAGHRVVRVRSQVDLLRDGREEHRELLVTTTTFSVEGQPRAVLMLEDITDVAELATAAPFCFQCGKPAEPGPFWEKMKTCFQQRWGIDLSRRLCPECAAKLYPGIEASLERGAANLG